ncbi:MAG: DUF4854 domain-containing protein [Lachnospiraceae bacterium]|nr:DUF4854 domain-containing protein [Lachnospiraceae bacterium]
MKKFAKLFVAAMMASMLLVGCGKEAAVVETETEETVVESTESVEESTEESTEVETETETETETEETVAGEFDNLEAYFTGHEDELQELIDSMTEGAEGLTCSLDVKENTMTFDFVMDQEIPADQLEATSEQMGTAMESTASVFSSVCKMMEDEVGVKDVVVVINYKDAKGSELYSASFNKDGVIE